MILFIHPEQGKYRTLATRVPTSTTHSYPLTTECSPHCHSLLILSPVPLLPTATRSFALPCSPSPHCLKLKASKLPKKHPRCLADGNKLLRFHGATLSCALGAGAGAGSSLCTSDKCTVCRIVRHGFSTKKEGKASVDVFTTSTSDRAFESIKAYDNDLATRKALLVCRVIAGRVHKPLDNLKEFVGQTGFDSLAGKVGPYSNIEE